MMEILLNTAPTVIGALIAGGVGYFSSLRIESHRRRLQKERWFNRLENLLRQLDSGVDMSEGFSNESERYKYSGILELVSEELTKHFVEAPVEIPDRVWTSHDQLLLDIEEFLDASIDGRDTELLNEVEEIEESAEEMRKWCEEATKDQDVGVIRGRIRAVCELFGDE